MRNVAVSASPFSKMLPPPVDEPQSADSSSPGSIVRSRSISGSPTWSSELLTPSTVSVSSVSLVIVAPSGAPQSTLIVTEPFCANAGTANRASSANAVSRDRRVFKIGSFLLCYLYPVVELRPVRFAASSPLRHGLRTLGWDA